MRNTRKRSCSRDRNIPPAKALKQDSSYRVHFGQYQGKSLSEVPLDVLQRWKKNIDKPGFRQATPALRAALLEIPIVATLQPPQPSTAFEPENASSDLGIEPSNLPASLHDEVKAELNKNDPGRTKGIKQESSYVMHSGAYQGLKLSEVPPSYLNWLKKSIDKKPNFFIPALRAASQEFPDSKPHKSVPPAGWTPPNGRFVPEKFKEGGYWEGDELWISAWDAKKFFGLRIGSLASIPLVDKGPKKRYWLYHLWDFSKFTRSRKEADAGLKAFLRKNEYRTEEIWDSMGLGACLLNDNM
ncbi:hypothetical protein BDZ45DRAFT_756039 [Acephala macrosclerotiorum]|nr:hypothetical protein BDZ45DRAFT_756039 [Acephala macrosclerotiorum]